MKKITRATFKSFINKAGDNLLVKVTSEFRGWDDCIHEIEDEFHKPERTEYNQYTLGIEGVWLVGHSDDRFTEYDTPTHYGIRFNNCCGSGIIAIAK